MKDNTCIEDFERQHFDYVGLQNILLGSSMGNLQVIGNPRLTDISALESYFECDNVTTPLATIGAVEVIPTVNPNPQSVVSCLLSTVEQVFHLQLPSIHRPSDS